MKPPRPTSVTFISWFLIVLCAANLVTIFAGLWENVARAFFKGPQSGPVALIGIGVTIVCAIFMLRGANWARWLYLGWVVLGTIGVAFLSRSLLVFAPGAIKTVVFGYLLTRKDATLFFTSRESASETTRSA